MSTTSAARPPDLARAVCAEALGTAFLVAGVVGSGIMAARLTQDMATALLCNTVATGAILTVLVAVFAPVSGAHLNPAVTFAFALRREIGARRALAYFCVQIAGAIAGVVCAHAMFGLPLLGTGAVIRTGTGEALSEAVATFGLFLTIAGTTSRGVPLTAAAVGLYIAAAYWFTASTSFANPAVTIARALTPSFSGIRPVDVPVFVLAQFTGAVLAAAVSGWLFGPRRGLILGAEALEPSN